MKHCPSCDFTFADFHHVCDFDGTELVPDPERPSLVKRTSRVACVRRWLKSPLFLVGLLTVGLLSSGLLIGYYDSASHSASLAKDQVSQPSLSASALSARTMEQTPVQIKTPAASGRGKIANAKTSGKTLRPKPAASHAIARSYQRRPVGNRSARAETDEQAEAAQISQSASVASPSLKPESSQREELQQISRTTSYGNRSTKPATAQRDPRQSSPSQPISHEKDSGFTAMLKTTWRVLKRPFKF
jgi:hypothetical protein